ncbi:MFS transporter [Halomonas mongoliensis]|uniref:MFS transporter n=1 Tax=Halomonas mongoliensis TaxID=321265 RepID=UPI00403AD276
MSLFRAPPSVIIVLAGIASALHMGKVPPALHVLGGDFSLSLFQSGLLLSLIQLAGMCGSIFIGLYADITGLKRNIMAGLFVLSSASLLGAQSGSGVLLLFFRALEGVGFLLVVLPAPAMIRHVVKEENLNFSLGAWGCFMGAGMGMALLIGPFAIQLVGWEGWWLAISGWTLIILALVYLRVPSDTSKTRERKETHPKQWASEIKVTLSHPGPWLIAGCFGLYAGQWLAIIGFLPSIYIQAGLGGTSVAYLTALVASSNVLGNLSSAYMMHRGVAPHKILYTGFVLIIIFSITTFSGADGQHFFLGFLSVLAFSTLSGLIPGALFSQAVKLSPKKNNVSTTVGWMQQVSAFGQFAFPPVTAMLASWVGGWQWTWVLTTTASLMALLLVFQLGRLSDGQVGDAAKEQLLPAKR